MGIPPSRQGSTTLTTTHLKSLGFATVLSVALTVVVRSQFGVETFQCEGSTCELGSGTRWVLTGLVIVGSFIIAGGFLWSARLEARGNLDPLANWTIPDAQQIVEVVFVIGAGLATYWLALNGPSIEGEDVRQVNQWANDLRNFRSESAATTNLVPARLTWFIIGGALATPFAFSFGTMVGREFYGRRRRKASAALAKGAATAAAAAPPMLGRSSLDIDHFELASDSGSSDSGFSEDGFDIDLNGIDNTIDAEE